MSSGWVPPDDPQLHVWFDGVRWWAVGREGSYGGDRSRDAAIQIACDATLTASHWFRHGERTIPAGQRRIVVHRMDRDVEFVIVQTRGKGSSQLFQDSVP